MVSFDKLSFDAKLKKSKENAIKCSAAIRTMFSQIKSLKNPFLFSMTCKKCKSEEYNRLISSCNRCTHSDFMTCLRFFDDSKLSLTFDLTLSQEVFVRHEELNSVFKELVAIVDSFEGKLFLSSETTIEEFDNIAARMMNPTEKRKLAKEFDMLHSEFSLIAEKVIKIKQIYFNLKKISQDRKSGLFDLLNLHKKDASDDKIFTTIVNFEKTISALISDVDIFKKDISELVQDEDFVNVLASSRKNIRFNIAPKDIRSDLRGMIHLEVRIGKIEDEKKAMTNFNTVCDFVSYVKQMGSITNFSNMFLKGLEICLFLS